MAGGASSPIVVFQTVGCRPSKLLFYLFLLSATLMAFGHKKQINNRLFCIVYCCCGSATTTGQKE
jgi:hypothetical protein